MAPPAEHSHRCAALALCCCGLCHPALAADIDGDTSRSLILESVNVAVNHRIVFVSDIDNWGRQDYWTTPEELFARGSGDCEDYAIAKFFALLAAGLPVEQLRIAYVQVLAGGIGDFWRPHIVVAYLPSADVVADDRILDNLIDEIRPLSRRPDLRILISFDTDGIWAGLERGQPVQEASRIKPWANVLERMGEGRSPAKQAARK